MAAHHHLSKGQFHKSRKKHEHSVEDLAEGSGIAVPKHEKRQEQPLPKHYRKKT